MTVTDPKAASAYRSHDAKRFAATLRTELDRADGDLYVTGDRLADDFGRSPADIERLLRELSGSSRASDHP